MEEAILEMMDPHWGKNQEVDKRLARFGIRQADSPADIERLELIARYYATIHLRGNTNKKTIAVQRTIRRKQNQRAKFGEERRET